MAKKDGYCVYINNEWKALSLESLVKYMKLQNPRPRIWSARLSTGLLGKTNCPSGNKGPKGFGEILLAIGDKGLYKLIKLGFITCPICRPDNVDKFWNIIQDVVQKKYDIDSLKNFVDKTILPFDARRVNWEEIASFNGHIGTSPNRIYVPKGLSKDELIQLRERFLKFTFFIPPIGYYNPDVPERFTPYQLY